MQPAYIEVTEVIQQADDPELALWMILIALVSNALRYFGKNIPNDQPGVLGLIGKICRLITFYVPNRERRDK